MNRQENGPVTYDKRFIADPDEMQGSQVLKAEGGNEQRKVVQLGR